MLAAAPGALAAATAFSGADLGGSPTPIGAGARALGMGGAFTAIADDATAVTWNPAGMTQLERPEAALSGGWYLRRDRSRDGSSTESDVDLDHASLILPFHLGVQQTVGLAWQREFDFTRGARLARTTVVDLGGGDSQTNDDRRTIDQQGSFAALDLSWAIEVVPGLSFGATLQEWANRATFGSAYGKRSTLVERQVFVLGGAVAGDTTSTTRVQDEVHVHRGESVVLGAHWLASERLTLGLTVKPRATLHLTTREDERQTTVDNQAGSVVSDDFFSVRSSGVLRLPTSVTVGAAVRIDDARTVSLDVSWIRWGEFMANDGRSPVSRWIAARDYRDGWSARLGYEHIVTLRRLVLVPRAGLLWEQVPSATPAPDLDHVEQVSARFDDSYGATLGLSAFREHVVWDVAAEGRWLPRAIGPQAPADRTADAFAVVVRAAVAFLF